MKETRTIKGSTKFGGGPKRKSPRREYIVFYVEEEFKESLEQEARELNVPLSTHIYNSLKAFREEHG